MMSRLLNNLADRHGAPWGSLSRLRPTMPWRSWLLSTTLLLCLPEAGPAQVQGSGENTVRGLLEQHVTAFNAGTEALSNSLALTFEDGVDLDAELDRWARWRHIHGELVLHGVLIDRPDRFRAFYRGRVTHSWVELTANLSRKDPGRLRNIALGSGLRPALEGVPEPMDLASALSKVRAYFASMENADLFSGTVLVAIGDSVVLEEAYGYRDAARSIPVTSQSTFNIGSITKVFTALRVMQLVETGDLGLERPIVELSLGVPDSMVQGILVAQLLDHTSGIGRGAYDRSLFPFNDLTVEQLVPLTIASPDFPPGTDVRYSNAAFILLGRALELIAGRDYYEQMDEYIFQRAGMDRSGFFSVDDTVADKAECLTLGRFHRMDSVVLYEDGVRRSAVYLNGYRGSPAGMSYSSARDLHAFIRATVDHRLLSAPGTEQFLSPSVALPRESEHMPAMSYGMAWEIEDLAGHRILRKDGGTWGASARMAYVPDRDMTIVVLSNYDSIGIMAADHITDLLLGLDGLR